MRAVLSAFLPRLIMGLTILCVASCGVTPHSQSSPSGYYDGDEARWNETELTVCWEADSSALNDLTYYQNIVREVVTSQYRRVGFTFKGWGSCADLAKADIRVWVSPHTWPRVNAFGRKLHNLDHGVHLTFDFLAAGNGWALVCQDQKNLANCIRNYALHEFGHALGLKHEADRDDATCEQKTNSPGINIGGYDALSIMNYCANEMDIRTNQYPVLSYNDVATLLHVYHRGSRHDTFAAIAWSPGTGAYGTSWRWLSQGAAMNTALGHCEQYGGRPGDCQVMAWAQNACAALAVGHSKAYGWAWNTDIEAAKSAALGQCQQHDNGCKLLVAVCSAQD